MTYEEALKIIENEKQCVIRAENCNRDCAKCDLLKPAQQILEAYDVAEEALEKHIPKKPTKPIEGGDYFCPTCRGYIERGHRCHHNGCGQCIDWE